MADLDKERAGVFDALGHPTRISILKLLSHEALSFADLKRKTDISSSGHLQHHLAKLDGLIRTDEHGNYRLSDVGNDALFAMQAVVATSRKRRHKLASQSRRSRVLLSIIIAAFAVCSIMSALYIEDINSAMASYATQTRADAIHYVDEADRYAKDAYQHMNETQYIAKNQYVCDIIKGSLNSRDRLTIGPNPRPIEIAPQQIFKYTAMVFSPSTDPKQHYCTNESATIVISPPESNETYYRQGFLKFEATTICYDGDAVVDFEWYPIDGPEGWNEQILPPYYYGDIPPYPTVTTQSSTSGFVTGGIPLYDEFIIPIEVYGNYTFRLKNRGDCTLSLTWTITDPLITFTTKPLQEYMYPNWTPRYAGERIARIRQQMDFAEPSSSQNVLDLSPTFADAPTTAFDPTTLILLSVTISATISIYTIRRKKA